MRTKILACQTIEDELLYAMKETGVDYEILWLESGLHNVPAKLQSRVQEVLDGAVDCDRVLLAFGRCGNAMDGITSSNAELILPKADDCISLLFGSDEARNQYGTANKAYFMTEGWMRGERNILVEYEYSVKEYGEEMAQELAEMMYAHYEQLALLDTGVTPWDRLYRMTEPVEQALNLKRARVSVTLDYIRDLLTGPWPEDRFYHVMRGERLIVKGSAAIQG